MGNQNEKQGKVMEQQQQSQSAVAESVEEIYKITTEKLLASMISRGKQSTQSLTATTPGSSSLEPPQEQTRKMSRSLTRMPNQSSQPSRYLQNCVGYLQAEEQGEVTITGSAFLVHRHLAITCAHNCMKPNSRIEYPSLHLCLKQNNSINKIKVKKAHYLDELFKGEGLLKSQNYLDFSVLQLQKEVDQSQGYLGVVFDYDQVNPSTPVTVVGTRGENNEIYRRETKLTSMSPKVIGISGKFDPKTYGGPLVVQINGQYFAYGVILWSDPVSQEITRGYKLYRYLYELLNTNFSRTVGIVNLKYRWVTNDKMQRIMREKYQLVTDLILQGNRVGAVGIGYLVKGHWSQLRHINLNSNSIEDAGMQTLCMGNWPKLTTLKVDNNTLTTEGIVHIKNTNWSELRHLSLSENKIKNRGLEAVLQGPWSNLFQLDLFQTHINQDGVRMLVEANYNNLQSLDLGANRIREEGVKLLVTAQWTDLHTLVLSQASITDAAVMNLQNANWPNLKNLDLSRNHLTHVGVQVLLRCEWVKLKDLSLRENKISIKGLSNLTNSKWTQLQQIDVRWNSLSEADKQSFRNLLGKSFPKLKSYV